MTLQIRRALGNGITKTLTKAGLTFIVLFGIVEVVFLAATLTVTDAVIASLDPPAEATQPTTSMPLSLPVSATVAGIIGIVGALIMVLLSVMLIRVMTAEQQTITRGIYTRRIGWVFLNSIVAGVVVGLLTMIGLVLFVIPGLFLSMSLLFTVIYIADEDENFISAIRDSWNLTSGNRWRLFGLYLVASILSMVVSSVPGFVLSSGSTLSLVVSTVFITAVTVYLIAIFTDAYCQLRNETRSGQGANPNPDVAGM
ncbi:hypothetical protein [Halococcus thailandensis]|uniref:DUF7847 domain-containing protein n=1 Tax=Halococcus thailandensis JCM 13552 TaxID=1227457 RepID=M0NIS1_9EURY|nr:hypothetical protein [Halococcus thailandensis]EMA56560.1 hypothetical protein C451_01738 [Halococcus thailandensis JCM 13552]